VSFAVPVSAIASAPSVDAREITAERAAHVVRLMESQKALEEFIAYLGRVCEDHHSMRYDPILPSHPEWIGRLTSFLTFLPAGSTHSIVLMDGCSLDLMAKDVLIRSHELIAVLTGAWTSVITAITARVAEASMPEWKEHEEHLIEVCPPHAIVRRLLMSKGYEILPDICAKLTQLADAAKPVHGVTPVALTVVQDAREAAKAGNLQVAITYCLYHLTVTLPKLKGAKQKASAATALMADLGTTFKILPKCMRAEIERLSALAA
jgi:hypothetical protein